MQKRCASRNPEAAANASGDVGGEGRAGHSQHHKAGAEGGMSVKSTPAASPQEANKMLTAECLSA